LYHDFYSDFDKRFDGKNVCLATAEEVAPFAPRVYVEGSKFEMSLYCAPVEYYLLYIYTTLLVQLSSGYILQVDSAFSVGGPWACLRVVYSGGDLLDGGLVLKAQSSLSRIVVNIGLS
jgi:hypothetical protein